MPLATIAFGIANVVFERALTVTDVSVRQELAWALGRHVVESGAEAHRLSTGLRFEIIGDRNQNAANGSSQQGGAGLPDLLDSSQHSTRGGAWLQDRFGARRARVGGGRPAVGLRRHHRRVLVSPRVAGTVNLDPASRLKAALGMYTQSPGYEKLHHCSRLPRGRTVDAATHERARARCTLGPWSSDLARGADRARRPVSQALRSPDRRAGWRRRRSGRRGSRTYDFPPSLQSEIRPTRS